MKSRLSKSVNRVNKKMSLHFKFLKHYLKREVGWSICLTKRVHSPNLDVFMWWYNMCLFSNLNKCISFMQDYSASGWEDIRTVVLAHLQRLDTTLSSQWALCVCCVHICYLYIYLSIHISNYFFTCLLVCFFNVLIYFVVMYSQLRGVNHFFILNNDVIDLGYT